MYLGYQKGLIKFYSETPLNRTLYNLDKVEETELEYVLDGEEYVLKTQAWEEEQYKKQRRKEILARLDEIDLKSIRAIRASDVEYIKAYETEAETLREELRGLENDNI